MEEISGAMRPFATFGHQYRKHPLLAIVICLVIQGCGGGANDKQNLMEGADEVSPMPAENGTPANSSTDPQPTDSIPGGIGGSDSVPTPSIGEAIPTDSATDPDNSQVGTTDGSNSEGTNTDSNADLSGIAVEPDVPEFNAIPDTDLDGIPDVTETEADRDRDSIPNYLDKDSDGDGIPDEVEGSDDADSDTIPNFLDLDSDGDSGSDQLEGSGDVDQDGIANYLDPDSDNDGIRDILERWADTDLDGVIDAEDLDSDDDGIEDSVEGIGDIDADGVRNYIDDDSDDDGLPDSVEGADDFDADGLVNAYDTDSDDDGLSDKDEGLADSDADGSPDYLDVPLIPQVAAELAISFDANKLHFEWDDIADADLYQLYRNADGASGFVPVGDALSAGVNSLTIEIDVHLSVESSFMLQSCAQNGCVDSSEQFISEGLVNAIGYLKASHTQSSPLNYGAVVAISGDAQTMAIGAPGDTNSDAGVDASQSSADLARTNSGAVFVYARTPTGWTEQAFIKADNPRASDYFGHSISLSDDGQTLAVGASREDSNARGIDGYKLSYTALDSGAVFIFTREQTIWQQSAYIKSSNSDADDRFGTSVTLSGDGTTLAIGAPNEASASVGVAGDSSDNSSVESGAVYVFSTAGGSWSEQAYIKADQHNAGDLFGQSVSLDDTGRILVVGAPGEDAGLTAGSLNATDNSISNAGAGYVFRYDTGTWLQAAYVKASHPGEEDAFGLPVIMSGDGSTLVIAASQDDSNSLGINADPINDFTPNAGAVHVYTHDGLGWLAEAYVKPPATKPYSFFGRSLSITDDGHSLAIGAYGDASAAIGLDGDSNGIGASYAGAVHLYHREAGAWSYARYLKASNTDAGDAFGTSVSISDDGSKVLVGASQEQSLANGFQGDASSNDSAGAGAAYLY